MSAEPMAVDDAPGPGTVLGGRYRLLRLLGEGGMGRVFLADDAREGGRVAVKLLSDDRPIPKATQRFEREARSLARIDHANVVRVTDVGQSPRGGLFYVMEHLEGEELATTLAREGPMPWPRARHIALQICSALQAAHEAGIVHRDLKLENCFRVPRADDPDFVKILDFGVVKLLSPELDDGERLTNTGATLGTPAYMAPELCRGKQVDHRVDVYALGVMLYELLTGGVPFEGDSFLDVALKHMNDPPPPLSEHLPAADLPDGLEAVVMRALAKAREDRFPTMAAFGRALERVGEAADAPLPAREPESLPLTAPGGTAPALPAAAGSTVPVLPTVGAVPVARARTQPRLEDIDAHEPARPRFAWPWLVLASLAAAGLVAWGMSAAAPSPSERDAKPEVAVETKPTVIEAPVHAAEAAETAPSPHPPSEPGPVAATTGSASVASPTPAPVVSGLSERQIDEVLRRMQPKVSACAGSLTGGRRGDKVRVVLRVDRATGKVTSVEPKAPGDRFAVESCLVDVLRKTRFPRVGGRGTQKLERTLVL